jgi:hypothetical protein
MARWEPVIFLRQRKIQALFNALTRLASGVIRLSEGAVLHHGIEFEERYLFDDEHSG